MSTWHGKRRADVVILTALRVEFDAVLRVEAGAVSASLWDVVEGPSGLPVAFRAFVVERGRPLQVAVAMSPDVGAPAATNTLLLLVDTLRPQCIAMCGVCAGRRGRTNLGDVVAARRLFYHDTGKRLPDQIQQDLTAYNLRDDWKAALDGMATMAAERFRDEAWFAARPITTEWRERRALKALCDGLDEPWNDVDPTGDEGTWPRIVASLRSQKLLAESGREVTDHGRRVIEDVLFQHRGAFPDLSPSAVFQSFRLHVAPMGSGSQVIEDEQVWSFISTAMRTTLGLDMEGAALAELVHRQRHYKLDAVVMKGVMDFADHGRDDHFKEFAARASAECLLWFLRERIPTEPIDNLLNPGTSPLRSPRSPASLLAARHTVARWYEGCRAPTLAELDAWAEDSSLDVSLRLLHAAGGVGKTRLAIEWVRRRREQRDVAGFLAAKLNPGWLQSLRSLGATVLIVIDYAESRTDLLEILEQIAEQGPVTGPRCRMRVLLLARGGGDWWETLLSSGQIADLIGGDPLTLPPLAETPATREAVFAEAAQKFADDLGRRPVSRPPLEDSRFEHVLYLHMAALAAVVGDPFDAGSLMGVILDREQGLWSTSRSMPALAEDVATARELIAAATLRGGVATKKETWQICTRLLEREFGREDSELIAQLHQRYGRTGMYLPALEPDLLGEALICRVARTIGRPAGDVWIDRVVIPTDNDEHILTSAFTVMARASITDAAVRPWIVRLLQSDLLRRAVVALRVAKNVGKQTAFSHLGDALADVLEQFGTSDIARELLTEEVPSRTISLQRVLVWQLRTLLAVTSAGGRVLERAIRADLLLQYGSALAALGRHVEAFVPTEQSVTLYRGLADESPDKFHHELARSLNKLGNRLHALGRRDQALRATRESANLFGKLVACNRETVEPYLARSLNSLGDRWSDIGEHEQALAVTLEAVELRRGILARDPRNPKLQASLASCLNNLGDRLAAFGRHVEALEATREAVGLRRVLVERNPDAYHPDLATSLRDLGIRLGALGQATEALEAAREAADLYRILATRNPEALQPGLASSLYNLGVRLGDVGDREHALRVAREAADVYRVLAKRNADVFQAGLATSLDDLARRLNDVELAAEALEVAREADELNRMLAARSPVRPLPG